MSNARKISRTRVALLRRWVRESSGFPVGHRGYPHVESKQKRWQSSSRALGDVEDTGDNKGLAVALSAANPSNINCDESQGPVLFSCRSISDYMPVTTTSQTFGAGQQVSLPFSMSGGKSSLSPRRKERLVSLIVNRGCR